MQYPHMYANRHCYSREQRAAEWEPGGGGGMRLKVTVLTCRVLPRRHPGPGVPRIMLENRGRAWISLSSAHLSTCTVAVQMFEILRMYPLRVRSFTGFCFALIDVVFAQHFTFQIAVKDQVPSETEKTCSQTGPPTCLHTMCYYESSSF